MRVCSVCHRCYETEVVSCTEESHPSLSETRSGSCEMIAGYVLDHLLESGVKGELYGAHHIASGRSCLIKILSADAQYSHQFLQESQLAAALFHPNVVDIYDVGSLTNGELFVVTEDPGGQTLRDLLNTVGVPQLLTSIQIARQTAEALHAIHLKGLTHRAVNPENIILTTDFEHRLLVRIKGVDFGGVIEHSIVSNKFLIDSAIDSLKYFSPEQCSGEAVGMKTDVYSLGIVLYEMLAGAPPFDASKAAGLIEQHRNERPPEIKIDDFELRMLVTHTLMESLTKRPEKRQSSANAFARQLRHIEQLATHVSTPPPAGVVPPPPQRSTFSAAAAAPKRSVYIRPRAMIETPTSIFEVMTEPASVINLEGFTNDLPEISYLLSPEPPVENVVPVIENFVQESGTHTERLSRMKLLRKKLHQMAAPHPPQMPERASVMPVSEQATPAEIVAMQAEPQEIAAISVQSHPIKIEWDQPEDDNPSVADVLEVLSVKQITEIPPKPQVIVAEREEIATIPIQSYEHKIEWDQPEDDIPSVADVLEVLSMEQITEIPPKPEVIVAGQEKPDEITVVSSPGRRIKVEWDQPAAPQRFFPDQRSSAHAWDDVTFVPTILGAPRESKIIDVDLGDSILSAYHASSSTHFSVSYRPLMIGGGFLALIALFLFASYLIGRYASIETSGESVAATTTRTTETLPPAAQANVVSPPKQPALKNLKKPLPEDNDSAANQSKPALTKENPPLFGKGSPTSPSQKAGKTPFVPSTLVISSDNGKIKVKTEPEKNSASKKPLAIAAGTIRPRIVKDPKAETRP